MRRTITILLALVMILSFAACGGSITKDDLEKALKTTNEDIVLQKEDGVENEYHYSQESATETSEYVVKTKNGTDAVESLEITYHNVDTTRLGSTDSIMKVIDVIMNRPNDSTLGDMKVGICISQVMNLVTLFDSSTKKMNTTELLSGVAEVFTTGSAQFGSWTITSRMDNSNNTLTIAVRQ